MLPADVARCPGLATSDGLAGQFQAAHEVGA